jgi:hypothetical protein
MARGQGAMAPFIVNSESPKRNSGVLATETSAAGAASRISAMVDRAAIPGSTVAALASD